MTKIRHRKMLQNCTTVTAKTLQNVVNKHKNDAVLEKVSKIDQRNKEAWLDLYLSLFHASDSAEPPSNEEPERSAKKSRQTTGRCLPNNPSELPKQLESKRRSNRSAVPVQATEIAQVPPDAAPPGRAKASKARKQPEPPVVLSPGDTVDLDGCTFEVGAHMATGADSTIFEGRCTRGKYKDTCVAIKMQPRADKVAYQITTEFTTLTILHAPPPPAAAAAPPLYAQRALAYGAHRGVCYVLVTAMLGPNLLSLLPPTGRHSARNVLLLAHQAVPLLHALHARGYVHRDIKPDNLVLGPAPDPAAAPAARAAAAAAHGQVHLIDLGTAEPLLDRHGRRRTQPQATEGTLPYMALSAHGRQAVSPRDDLEALGWTLVKLYIGSLPWETPAANPAHVAAAKRHFLAVGAAAALAAPAAAAAAGGGRTARGGGGGGGGGGECAEFMAEFFDSFLTAATAGRDGSGGVGGAATADGDYAGLAAAVAAAWKAGPDKELGRLPPPGSVDYGW